MQATIARPYSEALFKLAKSESNFDRWTEFLDNLQILVNDSTVQKLIPNPKFTSDNMRDLLLTVLGYSSDQEKNFIKILIQNKRLSIVSEISQQFEDLKSLYNNKTQVEVISAYELKQSEIENISKVVAKVLKVAVDVNVKIDKNLLGGVVIRAGDKVINASILNKIEQFANQTV